MQFSFVKSLLDSCWMVHPQVASSYYPLLQGALSGLEFMSESEPENSVPYLVSLSTNRVVTFSDPDDLSFSRDGDQYIFVLNLRGPILKHDAYCGPRGTRTLASRLARMDKEKSVIGHIIVTESGGGMAAAVPEMADVIQSLTKPVVAWIDGMSASAAYYINSYCSHIMASRSSDQVGCIGTLIQLHGYPKYAKLNDGSVVARIYADAATEKNDEYEAALEGNFTLIKERMLNPHNEQFISDVKTNRSAVNEEQLKGRTYNAGDVVGSLIDSIGSFNDAVNLVVSLAESNNTKSQNSNNKIKQMNGLINLNKIQSITGLELVDGHASLNEDQLNDIEQELANGNQAQSRVPELENQVNSLSSDVASRNSRISELESALEDSVDNGGVPPGKIDKKTDGDDNHSSDDSFSSAKSFCENHLNSVK